MIYTVTLNPALDYVVRADSFAFGKTNRLTEERIYPGGKGLNVSVMLSRLGEETTALSFAAGFTGEKLKRLLESEGAACEFFELSSGFTRINVKLLTAEEMPAKAGLLENSRITTELNGSGAVLTEEDIGKLERRLTELADGDMLVLSGSIPKGTDAGVYGRLLHTVRKGGKKIFCVLDSTGEAFLSGLREKPDLVKPNRDELEEMTGMHTESPEEIKTAAEKLRSLGAKNVLVSLGKDGAMLFAENGECYFEKAPEGKTVSTTAAGDSMIAGYLHAIARKQNGADALKKAVCAGSATAFSEWLGTKEEIEKLYMQLRTE